jgi:hypothetical protein
MIDINHYHWVWYLIGFMCAPKLTIMIFLSIYAKGMLPLPLFIIGWGLAILSTFSITTKK